jgi:hypothetical protein
MSDFRIDDNLNYISGSANMKYLSKLGIEEQLTFSYDLGNKFIKLN